MRTDRDAALLVHASRQRGAITRTQALALGISDPMLSRRLRCGMLTRVYSGVYVVAGTSKDVWQPLWAARLAVGRDALLSHECAAGLLGMPGFPISRPVLIDDHGQRQAIAGIRIHQLSDVLPSHRTVHEASGLPITTPARTIVDLAAVLHPSRVRHALDEMSAARMVDDLAVAQCLGDVARPGKRGVRALGAILDARTANGRRPPKSWLERELLAIAAEAGLPAPVKQLRFPGRMDLDGCVDFGWLETRLIVEADGRRWHTRIADVRRDRERDNQAARAGWQTLRFMHETMKADRADVGRTMREVYDRRHRDAAA